MAQQRPTVGAERLRGLKIGVYAGSGIPCDSDDVTRLAGEFPFPSFEPFLDVEAANLHEALVESAIGHRYVRRACGLHSYKYVDGDLHDWWPMAVSP